MKYDSNEWLRGKLAFMTPMQRRILSLRFGLDGDEPRTLVQVAQAIGISVHRIRTEEADALRRIKRGR